MGEVTHLMTHCTLTEHDHNVMGKHIRQWHLGPKDYNREGRKYVRYMGHNYPTRADLPNEEIAGVQIRDLKGNGWDRVGYRHLITINSFVHDLIDFDDDDIIEPWELTYGAAGWNGTTIHLAYAGGLRDGKNEDTRTALQKNVMKAMYLYYIEQYPNIKMIGHNQVSTKSCPNFPVFEWAEKIGIPKRNIDYNIYI